MSKKKDEEMKALESCVNALEGLSCNAIALGRIMNYLFDRYKHEMMEAKK